MICVLFLACNKKPLQNKGLKWRRGRDSNPGYLSIRRFSRPVLSTTQPPLLIIFFGGSDYRNCWSSPWGLLIHLISTLLIKVYLLKVFSYFEKCSPQKVRGLYRGFVTTQGCSRRNYLPPASFFKYYFLYAALSFFITCVEVRLGSSCFMLPARVISRASVLSSVNCYRWW